MTSPSADLTIDTELIELAEMVLKQAGYVVQRDDEGGTPYLLAEDQDNVITATAVISADDVETIEPMLTRVLVDRLSDRSLETKKWDGYVVILSSARPDDDATEALFGLTYNLNQVRRLVRVGIEPTTASVARGLRAVLPLGHTQVDAILTDPMDALRMRLIADGLDPEQLERAMVVFGSHGGGSAVAPIDDNVDLVSSDDGSEDDDS